MTPQRKLQLLEELHQARLDRRPRLDRLNVAKSDYLDKKSALRDATDVVEEILEEIETWKTTRPLIDLANHNGHPPEPAPGPIPIETRERARKLAEKIEADAEAKYGDGTIPGAKKRGRPRKSAL